MRLDKFLKVSRLIKRRTIANEISYQGRVLVNNNQAKPSKEIKPGDTITIEYFSKKLTVRVLSIPNGNISVQQAKELYEIIDDAINKI